MVAYVEEMATFFRPEDREGGGKTEGEEERKSYRDQTPRIGGETRANVIIVTRYERDTIDRS